MHIVDAKAIEDCKVIYIPKDAFWRVAELHPDFLMQALRSVAQMQADLTRNFIIQTTANSSQRVANALLVMKSDGVCQASQDKIAAMATTSRETVNKVIASFRKKGWVSKNSHAKYRIDQPDMLARLVGNHYQEP